MNSIVALFIILLTLTVLSLKSDGETHFLTIIMGPGEFHLTANESRAEKLSDNNRLAGSYLTNEVKSDPPPPDDAARMARYIVHYSSWGSLSHISLQTQINGSPLARIYSISDGPIKASSGIPYFYMTPNDPELRDLFQDQRASLTLTLAQTPYCRAKGYDPEDPRCAQVILTGKFIVLKNTTTEWYEAQKALFSRHPAMKNWPDSHHWVCCKLDIQRILVADNFGGNKYPSLEDYFKATPEVCGLDDPLLPMLLY